MDRSSWLARAAKFLIGIALVITVVTLVTQYLWNWLVPQIFHGPALSFGQALGLLALSRLLFGNWGRGGGGWSRGQAWKRKMRHKLASLSPEEREKFRQQMRARCMNSWAGRPTSAETTR